MFNFIRILIGSGFGTSLSIQLWTRREIFHHSRLAEAVTSYRPLTTEFYRNLEIDHPPLSFATTNQIVDKLVEQQAFMLATNELAWISAWMFILMIPLLFLCKPVKSSNQINEAAH